MRDLHARAQVYCQQALPAGQSRLFLTHGTVEVSGLPAGDSHYRTPAVVPLEDWREPTAAELDELLNLPGTARLLPPELTISVLPMPASVLAPFARLGLRSASTARDCEQLLDSEAYADAVTEAVLELWPFFESADGMRLLGTCVQAPNMRTTTTHQGENGQYTFSGLHIDDWGARAIEDRTQCERQMSINLGRCDRFLSFIALPVAEVARRVGRSDLGTYTELCAEFLRTSPGCEVIKVRIRPGEAYIAPTENLIHDGTTRGSDAPDITLNLRGRLRTMVDPQVAA